MSPKFFVIVIDWIMRKTTPDTPTGITCGTFATLEDRDCVDDLAIMSHKHQQIQDDTSKLQKYLGQMWLKIR